MLPPFPPASPGLGHEPTVSIVITNRDYAAFLPAAVDSALGQVGARAEVLVVDDGSTDGSRGIIAGYGDRVRALLLDGRGQKAAFNAGFAACSGDVVLFLDADDELRPGAVAAVVAAFGREPAAARVVFRLAVVDGQGRPTGACVPPVATPLASGDVRRAVLAFPDDLAWPPTSGNAFAAWALRRVMPIPVDDDRTGADSWLHPLIPLLGPVVALDEVHGSYRLHAANAHGRDGLDVARSRVILRRARGVHARTDALARELGPVPRDRGP
jgi:glycosyltransferase involved in cell wall biosynthesis